MAPIFNPSDNSNNNLTPLIATLSEAINSLKVQLPSFRITDPKPYEKTVGPEMLEIIAPLPQEQPRRTTVTNKGQGKVLLFFDEVPPSGETNATPWLLNPGDTYIDDRDGGYGVWGFSPEGTIISVGIQYPNIANGETEMPIPLNVDLVLGTGDNFEKSFPETLGFDAWRLQGFLDSDRGKTGYKLFNLSSFHPGTEYELTVATNSNIDFDTSKAEPVSIFLLDLNKIVTTFITLISNNKDFNYDIPKETIAWIKQGALVKTLPVEGGKFLLKPTFSRFIGHFSIYTQSSGAQGAVISYYDAATQTFNLSGY